MGGCPFLVYVSDKSKVKSKSKVEVKSKTLEALPPSHYKGLAP